MKALHLDFQKTKKIASPQNFTQPEANCGTQLIEADNLWPHIGGQLPFLETISYSK